jgi:hypothetical protein
LSRRRPSLPPALPTLQPHEARVTKLLRLGERPGTASEQHPRPRHSLFIDLFVDAREHLSVVWGPLRPRLAGRQVAVEIESGWVSEEKLRHHLAKALLATEAGEQGALVVICRIRPSKRLEASHAWELEPGIWQMPSVAGCDVYVVVPDDVGEGPGRSALRLLFATSDEHQVASRKKHLLTDPELPSDVRDAIWHIFTTKEIPMSYEELAHLGMREFHEASMRMGEERGRHEGRQEGRQEGAVPASLALAERLLPAEEVAALQALPPEQVLDAVAARLRPR